VYWTSDPQTKNRQIRDLRITLESIGTVEMCDSQLGSWFRLWLPTKPKLEKREVVFPPAAFQSFNRCFVALRELLASPMACSTDFQAVVSTTNSTMPV
jgi:hypothetical protein